MKCEYSAVKQLVFFFLISSTHFASHGFLDAIFTVRQQFCDQKILALF